MQRWEKTLALPIHRLQVGKQSSVYAYPSELDKWYREREPRDVKEDDFADAPSVAPDHGSNPTDSVATLIPTVETQPQIAIPFYRRKSTWMALIAFLMVFGVFVTHSIFSFPSFTSSPTPVASSDGKVRLFVRPLQNIAGDPGQADFTEGLTNELNTRLGRLDPKRLGVIAPTSSKQFGSKPISELEPLLKLNYVLEGSVRRGNDQVRIDVSLISAKEQTPLWSDSYTENLSDILKVQDEVAEAIAQKLLLNLPPVPAGALAASVDPEGYISYMRGRRAWTNRDRVASAKAKAEVQRALDLDPTSAEAHYVRGNILMYYDWDFPAAESELREAIRLEPGNATAHQWLAQYFMIEKRLSEAQAETDIALELDPVSPIFTTTRAEAFYYGYNFDAAIAQAKLTLEQYPNSLLGEFWLASAYREKKMYPEAIQHFRRAGSLAPNNPALLMELGHALAVSGDKPAALAVLADLQALAKLRYVPVAYYAGIYLGLGDKEQTFMWLDRAVKERDDRVIYLAVEPMADPIRSDPRFQALLTRIHLNPPKR